MTLDISCAGIYLSETNQPVCPKMAASELLNTFLFHFYYLHLPLHPLSPPGSPLIDYKHATSYPCACVSLKRSKAAGGFS